MGPSGAGKTAVAREIAAALDAPFMEGDDFHPALNVERMSAGIALTDADRAAWLSALASQLADASRREASIVLTCSALRQAYRDQLRSADSAIRFVCLIGSPELLQARLESRAPHFMPASLLTSQLLAFEAPAPAEQAWTYDVALPRDVIVADILSRLANTPLG